MHTIHVKLTCVLGGLTRTSADMCIIVSMVATRQTVKCITVPFKLCNGLYCISCVLVYGCKTSIDLESADLPVINDYILVKVGLAGASAD